MPMPDGDRAGMAPTHRQLEVFRAYVEKQVEAVNGSLARYETIKKVALLPSELTVESGELTPTLKLKRRAILERHRDAIDALYA